MVAYLLLQRRKVTMVNDRHSLLKILAAALVAGILIALAMAPVAGFAGFAATTTNATMQSNLEDMTTERMPGVTTINDSTGQPMAHLFSQRRYPVAPEQISPSMKDAIVAIEDRRFYEHEGVDIQGTARALVTNILAGGVQQGASTLNQQYVKNYLLHVAATTPEEQKAATERSVTRKLREMRMATQLDDELSKDEILSRYLNVVPFGNHAYGIEAAARTYFGISAAELNVGQSAMLAGMVQSSEYLNPYTNYDGVVARRNTVLQAMVDFGALGQAEADTISLEPLGVLESPATLANGCIAAGDRGFFCDYAVTYLESKGITEDQIFNDSLTVTTTLDPQTQDAAHNSVTAMVDPLQPGVAEVLNVVEPGQESHDILAMTSSRNYGLDLDKGETYLPQPTSLVGNGAGSVFKVFTAAAALEQGTGLDEIMPVPTRYEARGLGAGGAANCPANTYCVENAGTYQPQMTLEQALAYSPNTTFVMLIERVGVDAVVDMSVKLGLRSYVEPQTYNEDYSIAEYFKEANLGSYTLGPTAVNPLELANVGATLGSSGKWCEPNPVLSVTNREGIEIALDRPACEQVVEPQLANALADALTADVEYGTARDAGAGFGGLASTKTGTTESNQSSAFLGFNSAFAAAPYIYNDGTTISPLCTSPVRQCSYGNLFGGLEPARSYFLTAQGSPQAMQGGLPGSDTGDYKRGTSDALFGDLRGLSESVARQRLSARGYSVVGTMTIPGMGLPAGTLVGVSQTGNGRDVQLLISDGTGYVPAPDPAAPQGQPQPSPAPAPAPAPPPVNLDRLAEDLDSAFQDLATQFGF